MSADAPLTLLEGVEVMDRDGGQVTLRVARQAAPQITAHLLHTLPVIDLAVEDPPIEAVIDQVYREGEVG